MFFHESLQNWMGYRMQVIINLVVEVNFLRPSLLCGGIFHIPCGMVSLESPFNFESNGTYAQEFGGITYYKSTRSKITCFWVQKVSKK